jgi:hypothetical protein
MGLDVCTLLEVVLDVEEEVLEVVLEVVVEVEEVVCTLLEASSLVPSSDTLICGSGASTRVSVGGIHRLCSIGEGYVVITV